MNVSLYGCKELKGFTSITYIILIVIHYGCEEQHPKILNKNWSYQHYKKITIYQHKFLVTAETSVYIDNVYLRTFDGLLV